MASIFSTGTVVSSPRSSTVRAPAISSCSSLPSCRWFTSSWPPRCGGWGRAKGYITPGDMLGDFYKSRPVVFWCAAIGLLAVLPYAVAQLVAIGKTLRGPHRRQDQLLLGRHRRVDFHRPVHVFRWCPRRGVDRYDPGVHLRYAADHRRYSGRQMVGRLGADGGDADQ